MASEEHLAILAQGVETWNGWRQKKPHIIPDLSDASLISAKLRGINLAFANLCGASVISANLRGADLTSADLRNACLMQTNFCEANLSQANLSQANLGFAYFIEANVISANFDKAVLTSANLSSANFSLASLCEAVLTYADLSNANFSAAYLCGANLSVTRAIDVNFYQSNFTGACLEDWNINDATNLSGVTCSYIYLKARGSPFGERRPRNGSFQSGEFAALFQQVVDTVDLFFEDGIDWRAFFQSFQDLCQEYADEELAIQAIEKKRGGSFVVRLEVSSDADKSAIESSAKERYEAQLVLVEQRYRAELNAKDREIVAYREQSANLMKITELLASKPMTSDINQNFHGPVGNVAGTNQGKQQNIQHNYAADNQSLAEAAAEIQALLKQLEQTAPSESMSEKMALATQAIAQIESDPTLKQRAVAALSTGGLKAFEAAIDHPVAAFVVGAIEGWKDAE